jgi:hypothetical protein
MKLQLVPEYFHFEQDFMEDNIRCIPMIVRFKLDACGIKLKLKEWSKMAVYEREQLASLPIDSSADLDIYRIYLTAIIHKHTGAEATVIPDYNVNDLWHSINQLPEVLREKLIALEMNISTDQWTSLSALRRFALIKLTRPGHENKNFPKAMREFGLA